MKGNSIKMHQLSVFFWFTSILKPFVSQFSCYIHTIRGIYRDITMRKWGNSSEISFFFANFAAENGFFF